MQRTAPRITDWSLVPLTFGSEYAELLLGIPRKEIRKLCRTGQFPGRKVGKHWFFEREAVRGFLTNTNASQEVKP